MSGCLNQCCFDHRYPSYTSPYSVNPTSRVGFIPAGSYAFNKDQAIWDSCSNKSMTGNQMFISTGGPKIGITMGSCVPRASSLSLMDKVGSYSQGSIFGAPQSVRGCYL